LAFSVSCLTNVLVWAAAEGRKRGNGVYMGTKRLFCLFSLLEEPVQVRFVSMRHF